MASFDTVTARADRILIVATGLTAQALDLSLVSAARSAGVHVIGVNRAFEWLPHMDSWFTLDPDHRLLSFINADNPGPQRYVAIPDDYGMPDAFVDYHRDIPQNPQVKYLHRITGDMPMKAHQGLATNPGGVHTGNSSYGALGVAFHMKPRKIAMVGVDANRHYGYAHAKGRPRNLNHLPHLFEIARRQIVTSRCQIVNGSPPSMVQCFRKMEPNAAVHWLMGRV